MQNLRLEIIPIPDLVPTDYSTSAIKNLKMTGVFTRIQEEDHQGNITIIIAVEGKITASYTRGSHIWFIEASIPPTARWNYVAHDNQEATHLYNFLKEMGCRVPPNFTPPDNPQKSYHISKIPLGKNDSRIWKRIDKSSDTPDIYLIHLTDTIFLRTDGFGGCTIFHSRNLTLNFGSSEWIPLDDTHTFRLHSEPFDG